MLLLVPVWPGFLGLVTLACQKRRLGGLLAVSGAVPALGVALNPPLSYEASYSWLLLGTQFGVDEADAVFLLFTAIVWFLASGFAFGWVRRDQGRERFFALFLLTMSGNLGALVAQDMPSFYALFALMSFSAYGLVAHELTREARHAANVYLVLVVVGEAAIAAAMILAAGALGADDFMSVRKGLESLPLRHVIIALAFVGFGIKAGVLILHVWLPLAHPVAPAPASAVLSGTIIVTGLVGWLRFLPVGQWALPGWGDMCIALGFSAAFYGAIVGTDQRDPKVVLAYSSISQMGIMTVGLGMMLLEPASAGTLRVAVALFALHHGLAKSTLFLGAGLSKTGMGTARRRALVIGLALPSLALAGAPFTSGMVVKSAIVAGETVLPERWASAIHFLLPLTSVATALLMARFLVLVNRRLVATEPQAGAGPWLILCISVALVLLLPLWLTRAAGFSWNAPTFIGSLWPLGAACAVALVAIGIWRRAGRPSVPTIPAGDVLLPMERLTLRVRDGVRSAIMLVYPLRERLQAVTATGRGFAWTLIQSTRGTEALLSRWRVALTVAVVVGSVLALLAA
jgi:formate hydrogenlyase subunit 3/multisubunit Na+/H+ antiporter MnhD subunit